MTRDTVSSLRPSLEDHLHDEYGPRCETFEPGCPVCDMWEAYDLHAYGAINTEMKELAAWVAEWEEATKDVDWTPPADEDNPPYPIEVGNLVGRTIFSATTWSDSRESLSILLDDGGILQISAHTGNEANNFEPVLHYEVEYAVDEDNTALTKLLRSPSADVDISTYELPVAKVDPADYQGWLTIEGGTDQ